MAAPCLLLVLILDAERGRVMGRTTALRGRCIVFALGEVGGEAVAILTGGGAQAGSAKGETGTLGRTGIGSASAVYFSGTGTTM